MQASVICWTYTPWSTGRCQHDKYISWEGFLTYGLPGTQYPRKAINQSPLSAAYMPRWNGTALLQVLACHQFGAKPLPEPMLTNCQFHPYLGTNFSEIQIEIQNLSFMKMHLKMLSVKWQPFCPEGYELRLITHPFYITSTDNPPHYNDITRTS